MASVINSARAERTARGASFAGAIGSGIPSGGILLAFECLDVERTGRLLGRRNARTVLARVTEAANIASRIVRGSDLVVHDGASELITIVLDRGRDPATGIAPPRSVRAIVARLSAAFARVSPLEFRCGWTYTTQIDSAAAFATQIGAALARGEREAQRLDFFAAVGHELRTPLTAIASYVDYLLRVDPEIVVDERRALGIVREQTEHLSRLIDAMIDLSLLDGPNPEFTGTCADGIATVESVIDATALLAHERLSSVVLTFADPVTFTVSPMIVQQLLINVVENALKHGRSGGRVEIALRNRGGMAAIDVDDDGPGIAPVDRDSVFERGFSGGQAGHGLGFAFVRAAARAADGDVAIETSPLGGARVRLLLPARSR